MSAFGKNSFEERYNNSTTGLFRAGQDRGIGSDDYRDLVTTIKDSLINGVDDLQKLTTATGENDYAITAGITSLVSGYMVVVKFSNASTGACTLNPNSLGAKKLYINPTTQAGNGHIPANSICVCVYDATLDNPNGGFLIIAGLDNMDGGSA